jgi:5'-3' exoribonuclease 2
LTHEAHFFILREKAFAKVVEFQFVKIAVFREYLLLEFKDINIPFGFDFERIVDDFVFLCYFVGNDFLPYLPALQMREGALDAIMVIYKNLLPAMAGYLTNQDKILFSNCDLLFKDIAKYEIEFFKYQKWKIQEHVGRKPS